MWWMCYSTVSYPVSWRCHGAELETQLGETRYPNRGCSAQDLHTNRMCAAPFDQSIAYLLLDRPYLFRKEPIAEPQHDHQLTGASAGGTDPYANLQRYLLREFFILLTHVWDGAVVHGLRQI
jgi:hypothetical protein